MLNALTPMFTFVAGVALFGTRIKGLQVWGLVVGLIGAAVLAFQPGMGASLEHGMVWGAGRVVLATACYGLSVNPIRNKLGHVPAAAVAALSLGLMSLPALAVALAGPGLSLAATHPDGPRGLIAVTVLAVVGTGLALIAFNRIIQKTNALFASTVTYIIPLFATMWGWLDDEPFTLLHLVGGAGVGGGLAGESRGEIGLGFSDFPTIFAAPLWEKFNTMYAIVEIAGHQYKVEKDQQVFVNRLDAEEGKKVKFDRVLLVDKGV